MNNSKNTRTVEDILNLETGENITASALLDNMEEDDIVLLRRQLRTANREGRPILVCAECSTKLELRCNKLSRVSRGENFYFFKHYKDSKECSIKTNSHLSIGDLLARKYENVKESQPHKDLKNDLGKIIKQFHSPEKISIDSKFYFDKSGNGERRKPDVYAVINGKEYAFEVQLNTTFLSVIEEREAFYERNHVSILWIFKHFPLEDELQRLTQKDIYVPNRMNAFVLDDEMLNLSTKERELHLRVYYKTFHVSDWEVCSKWNTEIITIGDLNYAEDYKPFFYDSFEDKKFAKQELEQKKEERRLERQRIRRIQRQNEERLAEQKRIKKQKISRCRTLINAIQSDIESLEERQSQLLLRGSDLESKIKRVETENHDISIQIAEINDIVGQMYNYLNRQVNQTRRYISNPLFQYCDTSSINSIENKYCERILNVETTKKEINSKLKSEIYPRKKFIDKFSTCDIGGITYSIIPLENTYEWVVEKFLEEIKIINTKDLGTIFEADCIRSITNTSYFRWCLQNRTDSITFLIDMSSKKSEIHFKENELNKQLHTISLQETACVVELKNDIVLLLNEKEKKNLILIEEYRNMLIEFQNTYKENVRRIDVLKKRKTLASDIYNAMS